MINWLIGGALLVLFVWAVYRTVRRKNYACGDGPRAASCHRAGGSPDDTQPGCGQRPQ